MSPTSAIVLTIAVFVFVMIVGIACVQGPRPKDRPYDH